MGVPALAVVLIGSAASVWLRGPDDATAGAGASAASETTGSDRPGPPPVQPVVLLDVSTGDARRLNEEQPFADVDNPVAPPFVYRGADLARARDCLAAAAWWEAGDDTAGGAAVAQVVLNRLRHPAFPKSVCGVVFQGSERRTGCQFTFTCDGSMAARRPSPAAWARAQSVAQGALAGRANAIVGLATHYHTPDVFPVWSSQLLKLSAAGGHLFFRWPGFWGERRAWKNAVLDTEPRIAALSPWSGAHGETGDLPPAVSDPASEAVGLGSSYPAEAQAGRGDAGLRTLPGSDGGDGEFEVVVPRDATGAAWALQALTLCRGQGVCNVTGWIDPVRRGQEPADFRYRRANGRDSVRWNCRAVSRPEPDQCLPNTRQGS